MNALPGQVGALGAGTGVERGDVGGQVDQHPVPEAARGRRVGVEAGDRVALGALGGALHDSCGEVLPAAATWSSLSGWPSVTSSLVTVNDGTCGQQVVRVGLHGSVEAHGSPESTTVRPRRGPSLRAATASSTRGPRMDR